MKAKATRKPIKSTTVQLMVAINVIESKVAAISAVLDLIFLGSKEAREDNLATLPAIREAIKAMQLQLDSMIPVAKLAQQFADNAAIASRRKEQFDAEKYAADVLNSSFARMGFEE